MAYKEAQSRSLTFFDGTWHEGNPMIMGPMTHAPWLGSCVFDGARAFEGDADHLDLHCQRIVRSAQSFGLKILKDAGEIEELKRSGIIDKGMIPKMDSAVAAISSGVDKVSLVDGRVPHSVLLEIFTDAGVGTELVR